MRKLSLLAILNFVLIFAWGQENPHGEKLSYSCTDCHTTDSWKYSAENSKFDHNKTEFILEGQHIYIRCSDCHTSLVFDEVKSNCIDCHSDLHNTTVGTDCARCHDSKSWIVDNITEIHQMGRFPLLGAHNSVSCSECHTSALQLEFEPLGIECIDCHQQDYMATSTPNHTQAGYSTDCIECHKIEAHEWSASGINHDFFPLNQGHNIADCSACHKGEVTEPISTDCYSCHQNNYNSATNPQHQNSGFSTDCVECHTISPDWSPANFKSHDAMFFPIYSGEHEGEWDNCTDCHTQPENYSNFSCINCHKHNKSEMDDEHRGINGYSYNSMACFSCHPTGNEKSTFNHSSTNFLLKGAHLASTCLDCHTNGFTGTSTECNSCHTNNYNMASNPNHVNAGIDVNCEACHTETDWKPSLFNHATTTSFELTNGHSGKQCSDCHTGTTSNASSDCVSCHQENYNNAKDHIASNFPTDCLQCHNNSNWSNSTFDHNATNFPLTGSHVATECNACHTEGYIGTPSLCADCHQSNYNATTNPNHSTLGISTNCNDCHTTNPDWIPASFPTHQNYFALNGAHATIASDCYLCHSGNYTNTPNTCFGCHSNDYNNTIDPAHATAQFSTDCIACHTENSWEPATFDHDNQYFPIYSGEHSNEWNSCNDCHTQSTNYAVFSCLNCHEHNITDMADDHSKVSDYVYNSTNCLSCHPTGDSDDG